MPNQNKQHIWLDLERVGRCKSSDLYSDFDPVIGPEPCVWKLDQVKHAQIHRRPGLEPLPWRLQQMETYVFRTCHFGFGGEALKSKKQLWRKKVRTTTSLVVSLHLSSPKNEKAAFFGLQRLEPSTHKLMASHAARRCATKPRKRLRIRLRTSCVCET